MRKGSWLFACLVGLAVAGLGWTQEKPSRDDTRKSTASSPKKESSHDDPSAASLRAGTKISAELTTNLDARTAKPGDEIAARVTKNVKQDGHVVVRKGDRLLGHITSLEGKGAAQANSRLAVMFDRLQQGEATTQLNTVITQVLSAQAAPDLEPSIAPPPTGASSGGGSRRGGGGVLGGTTAAVGQTASSTLGAAGSAVQGVQNTTGVGTRTSVGGGGKTGLATPIADIHLDSVAQFNNQNQATSVLSTKNGNLRLESGTLLQFRVAGQAETHKPGK